MAAKEGGATGDDPGLEAGLLAEASHELRGAAARLALMAEALAERALADPSPDVEARLRSLATEGRRVQALASTLLDTSRLAAEGRRLQPEAVPLAALVEGVLAGVTATAGTEVDVRVADDLKVWADPLALDQVLSNLIANAFQHGGRRVTIEGRADGAGAVVVVADDGPGLPAGGWRPTSAPPGPRPGLGLRITADLVARLDGELRYEAEAAGGARFVIHLPSL